MQSYLEPCYVRNLGSDSRIMMKLSIQSFSLLHFPSTVKTNHTRFCANTFDLGREAFAEFRTSYTYEHIKETDERNKI